MITFEPAADHVLAVRAEGKLTRDDIRAFVEELDAKLARHKKIGVVTDVTKLDGMTFAAFIEDLKSELKYLGKWDRFPNMALIATEGFLKTVAETFKKVLPQIDLRVFPPSEREQAFAFAAEAGMPHGGTGGSHDTDAPAQ
jgi:hypothetical protein